MVSLGEWVIAVLKKDGGTFGNTTEILYTHIYQLTNMKQLTHLAEEIIDLNNDGYDWSNENVEQLLTNYLQELLKDEEITDIDRGMDGNIGEWAVDIVTRNQLRQQLRVKAGIEEKEL